MACDSFERELVEYIDGELDPAEEMRLKAHMEKCRSCRAFFADVKRDNELFSSLSPFYPEKDFTTKVMHRIQNQRRRRETLAAAFFLLMYAASSVVQLPQNLTNLMSGIAEVLDFMEKLAVYLVGVFNAGITLVNIGGEILFEFEEFTLLLLKGIPILPMTVIGVVLFAHLYLLSRCITTRV